MSRSVGVVLLIIGTACCGAPAHGRRSRATPEEQQSCTAEGGRIQKVCLVGALQCVVPYADAGKSCNDKYDCIGACLYDGPDPAPTKASGKCQQTNEVCGCRARILDGKVGQRICVD